MNAAFCVYSHLPVSIKASGLIWEAWKKKKAMCSRACLIYGCFCVYFFMCGPLQIAVNIYEPQGFSYVDAYGTFLSNELLPLVEKTVTDKKVCHSPPWKKIQKGSGENLYTQHQYVSSENRFMKLTGTKMMMMLRNLSVRRTSLSLRRWSSRGSVPAVREQWLMEILSSATMWTVRPAWVTFRSVLGFISTQLSSKCNVFLSGMITPAWSACLSCPPTGSKWLLCALLCSAWSSQHPKEPGVCNRPELFNDGYQNRPGNGSTWVFFFFCKHAIFDKHIHLTDTGGNGGHPATTPRGGPLWHHLIWCWQRLLEGQTCESHQGKPGRGLGICGKNRTYWRFEGWFRLHNKCQPRCTLTHDFLWLGVFLLL